MVGDRTNGAEVWRLYSTSAPPLKALLESLPEERRPALRNAFVDLYERYRDSDGVRYPNEYLLVVATRPDRAGCATRRSGCSRR